MTVSAYLELRDSVTAWIRCPPSVEKRNAAPDLLIRMIDFFSNEDRQDLAKQQISNAIRALQRGDETGAGVHMQSALLQVPHAPVDLEWNVIRAEAEKLRTKPRRKWF